MSDHVDIRYIVPVVVTVDPATERVVRVVVLDEEATLDADYVRGIRRRERAARTAEGTEWPAWEFGS